MIRYRSEPKIWVILYLNRKEKRIPSPRFCGRAAHPPCQDRSSTSSCVQTPVIRRRKGARTGLAEVTHWDSAVGIGD
ncbi:hypothetical protein AAFF_G00150000 [Aldrovandia affinis]|uniref:Uncharacterized protein n=1 Tax=Aldrovandia affinis TaxID=143900 RepID=A0AAD7W8G5_9TELE|nr:hypothetical protein AAFF_G00150000 [Aldrovandia affinis]